MPSELFDLTADPGERRDIAGQGAGSAATTELSTRLNAYFDRHAAPEYDLWSGGRAKSNVTNMTFWQEAWGAEWGCVT